MKYIRPFDEETGTISLTAPWINENTGMGVEGSIPPAEFYHSVQMEMLAVLEEAGITPDGGDLTQLKQAILALTRVTADASQPGYRDIHVPAMYPTLQNAIDAIAPLAIPNGVTVRIFLAAGDHIVNLSTGTTVFDHPNGNRVQIIGANIGTFPSMASANLSTAAATLGVLETVFPTRVRITGAVYAGLYVKDGTIGLIKNVLFDGDGTTLQHGLLFGDWENGHGRAGGKVENCWFHKCGEDGLRINYNSEVVAKNIGASWCGKQGIRVVNSSSLTCTADTTVCRNTQAGLLCGDTSFFEQVTGKIDARNNGLNGVVAFNNSEVALGNNPQATGNTGYGFNSSNGAWMYTTAGSVTGGSNSLGDLGSFVQGRMQITGAAGLGLSASPSLNTLGNNNSYIMG